MFGAVAGLALKNPVAKLGRRALAGGTRTALGNMGKRIESSEMFTR